MVCSSKLGRYDLKIFIGIAIVQHIPQTKERNLLCLRENPATTSGAFFIKPSELS